MTLKMTLRLSLVISVDVFVLKFVQDVTESRAVISLILDLRIVTLLMRMTHVTMVTSHGHVLTVQTRSDIGLRVFRICLNFDLFLVVIHVRFIFSLPNDTLMNN